MQAIWSPLRLRAPVGGGRGSRTGNGCHAARCLLRRWFHVPGAVWSGHGELSSALGLLGAAPRLCQVEAIPPFALSRCAPSGPGIAPGAFSTCSRLVLHCVVRNLHQWSGPPADFATCSAWATDGSKSHLTTGELTRLRKIFLPTYPSNTHALPFCVVLTKFLRFLGWCT